MKKHFITACIMNKIINIKSKVEFFFEVLDSTLLLCIANRNSISQQRYQFDVTDKRILIDSKIVASDRTSKGGVEKSSS